MDIFINRIRLPFNVKLFYFKKGIFKQNSKFSEKVLNLMTAYNRYFLSTI